MERKFTGSGLGRLEIAGEIGWFWLCDLQTDAMLGVQIVALSNRFKDILRLKI
jgi:hypothetical protein